MSQSYKNSLNLPKTDFPMRANLPQKEPEILRKWGNQKVYEKLRDAKKDCPSYILHDGPPFANGDIHLGHVLNKVLKDIVIRYKTMRGFNAPYTPGWDCHGLPIEHQVVKKLKNEEKNPVSIRRKSAEYADGFIEKQKEQFQRLGVWADWDNPYLTKNPAYEADELRVFADLVEKGLVYQGLRPVFWSTGCRTALAEAEVEYDNRTDDAVFVKFPLTEDAVRELGMEQAGQVHLLVWTTTPWTLPANLAVAYNAYDVEYCAFKIFETDQVVILASGLAEKISESMKVKMNLVQKINPDILSRLRYHHPFLNREGQLFDADYVSDESGTGLVHIAPGHGHDDYLVGIKNGLPIISPVDEAGRFTDECGVESLKGKYVLDANADVIEILSGKGLLAAHEPYTHSYPHCWRSKTPIIFRSVKQWFISVSGFKANALENIEKVSWFPDWGQNRITGSVEARQDWCISRQRTWGVPIPVFYKGEEAVLSADVIRKFADIVEREGTDIWFSLSDEDLAERLGVGNGVRKGLDTLDVWIDSGSSFKSVVEGKLGFPADLYLEGSDQHRGWFQSSLLLSSAVNGQAPFKSVLTHGFVVDGDGKKMSKSVGNVIKPEEVMKTLGADILRLWVAASDFADDIRVSQDIFGRIADAYRKFRNTIRFALGNMHGHDPNRKLEFKDMPVMDQWILSRLANIVKSAECHYETFEYHKLYQEMYRFCTNDLSAVYFDIVKDRLYTDAVDSLSGQSARHALFVIAQTLLKILAPIMPFTADEAWSYIWPEDKDFTNIHFEAWPHDQVERFQNNALEERVGRLLEMRDVILGQLEKLREKKEIGNSLEAEVELHVFDSGLFDILNKDRELLELICLVSTLVITDKSDNDRAETAAVARRSNHDKCQRCWKRGPDVGKVKEFEDLCKRCIEVLKGQTCQS